MEELKTLGAIVAVLGPVAGTVVAVVYFLRHMATEAKRTDDRADRLFGSLERVVAEQAETIKANTSVVQSLHDLIATKTGTLAAQLDESTRTILSAIETKRPA